MALHKRATSRFLAAAVLVGSGALIAGCGGSSNSNSSSGVSPLLRAADLSTRAIGFKTTIHMREGIDFTTVRITGRGSFNTKASDGSMVMNLSAKGRSYSVQEVFDRDTYYMRFPPQIAGALGASTPWVSFSLNDIGRYAKVPGFASLVDSQSSGRDSTQFLKYLKATRDGSVQNLGQENVDGVQTTHYQAAFNLSQIAKSVPPSQRPAAEQLVKVLRQRYHANYSPYNVWIDQAGLVRKFAIDFSESAQGHVIGVTLDETFDSYGAQPAPHIPSASQDTDILSLIHNGG